LRRTTLAAIAAALVIPLAAAACSSSSSSSSPAAPTTGTETLTATVTGSAAAANLNNSNTNAPLDFPEAVWTGLIATSLKPFTLGGNGNAPGDVHWATAAGTSTVYHAPAAGYTNSNAPPPATWVKTGTDCSAHSTFSKGSFAYVPSKSTGEFARLSGSGTYTLIAQFTAPLMPGKTTCSFATIGKIVDSGAKIVFTGTAPATLKPASATATS
jgi:hypothetical protein